MRPCGRLIQIFFGLVLLPSVSMAKSVKPATRPVRTIVNVEQARQFLAANLEIFDGQTLFCGCEVLDTMINTKPCRYKIQKDRERAMQVVWQSVVSPDTYGPHFREWNRGSRKCVKDGHGYKGIECARTNPEFAKMEADLYNLFPESGEMSDLVSPLSAKELKKSEYDIGECKLKIAGAYYEPSDATKGVIARTVLNFAQRYSHLVVLSKAQRRMYLKWDQLFPVSKIECIRWQKFATQMLYQHRSIKKCAKL